MTPTVEGHSPLRNTLPVLRGCLCRAQVLTLQMDYYGSCNPEERIHGRKHGEVRGRWGPKGFGGETLCLSYTRRCGRSVRLGGGDRRGSLGFVCVCTLSRCDPSL
jgi:hypothetical protein